MINLCVEEYCQQCLDFAPDIIAPKRMMTEGGDIFWSDTIIQCKYHKRCAAIKKIFGAADERRCE